MSTLLLDPRALEPVLDDDDCDVLYLPAERQPVGDVPATLPEIWEAIWLEEGVVGYLKKKWDEHAHPRWPKGTPKAGEFMRKGDTFETKDGRRWQIISTAKGKIVAAEASGDVAHVEHRVFNADLKAVDGPGVAIPDVKPAAPKRLKGGSYYGDAPSMAENTTIVNPYVEPGSHDTSVAKPANSKLSADEWARFGADDQDYYVELMDRFGEWKAASAQAYMDALWAHYDSSVQHTLTTAFGLQYGPGYWGDEGGGRALNLAYLFANTENNPTSLKATWAKYEQAKTALDEINEVVHWDLYNRTRSPDITLFHGGGGQTPGAHYEKDFLTGKVPIYAGFSQSYKFDAAAGWGSQILATPVAIRHVAMSHYTRLPSKKSAMTHELEVAVGVRMKLDARSASFNSSAFGVQGTAATAAIGKWIRQSTKDQPASGSLVSDLKDVWAGKGNIPIPPEPPGIAPLYAAGGQTYTPLDSAIASKAGATAHTLKYKSDDGTKEAAIGLIDGMGLKEGDFIEGKQGTRYVIIADSADANGLRYVKIDPATKLPNYQKSYPFSASAGNEFYRLDGHIEIPKKKEVGFAAFTPEQYAMLVPGEKKLLANFSTGEMLKVEGEGYKVSGPGAGGKVNLESLDTGKGYSANSLYQAVPLIPKEGFVPPTITEEPNFTPKTGEFYVATNLGFNVLVTYLYPATDDPSAHRVALPGGAVHTVTLGDLAPVKQWVPDKAEPGDIFWRKGTKYTVTSTLKDGTIRAKPTGGKVEKFTPDEIKGTLFRPGQYGIGAKVKAGDLDVGDVISGSVSKVRPYVVLGDADNGKTVMLRNLETGVLTKTTKKKSWARLIDSSEIKDLKPQHAPKPETTVPETVPGDKTKLGRLDVGEQFFWNHTKWEVVTKVDGTSGGVREVKPDGTFGNELDVGGLDHMTVVKAEAKEAPEPSSFDKSLYIEGDKVKVSDMEEGQVFLTPTGLVALLKSKKPEKGATAVALYNGKLIKNIGYDKALTILKPKEDEPFDYDQMEQGDHATLDKFKVGDQVAHGDDIYQIVAGGGQEDYELRVVLSAGLLGTHPWHPGNGTSFALHKKGAEIGPPPLGVSSKPLDADTIPDVPETFSPYLHPKSGSSKYPKLVQMGEGAQFTDKSGTQWIIKHVNDEFAFVTDGASNYKVSAHARGKVAPSTLFDGSPPIGGGVADAEAKTLIDSMEATSEEGPTLGELLVGDYFQSGLHVYEISGKGIGHVLGKDVTSGAVLTFGTDHIPTKYAASEQAQPSPVSEKPSDAEQFIAKWKDAGMNKIADALGDLAPDELKAVVQHAQTVPGASQIVALGIQIQKIEVLDVHPPPNVAPQTVYAYTLEVGDYVWQDGAHYTITAVKGKGVNRSATGHQVESGAGVVFSSGDLVHHAELPAAGTAEHSMTATATPSLTPGDTFTFTPAGVNVYKLLSLDGKKFSAESMQSGTTFDGTTDKIPTVYGVVKSDEPAVPMTDTAEYSAYLDAPSWPEGTPLPVAGDWIKYATPETGIVTAQVAEVQPFGEGQMWTVYANGEPLEVGYEDLVGPTEDPGLPFDVGQQVVWTERNDENLAIAKFAGTEGTVVGPAAKGHIQVKVTKVMPDSYFTVGELATPHPKMLKAHTGQKTWDPSKSRPWPPEITQVGHLPVGTIFASKGGDFGVWEITPADEGKTGIVMVQAGASNDASMVGETATMYDGPIPPGWSALWIPPPEPEPALAAGAGTFGELPTGAVFEAHDARWEKLGGGGGAKILATWGKQMAEVGYIDYGFTDDEPVAVSAPDPLAEIKALYPEGAKVVGATAGESGQFNGEVSDHALGGPEMDEPVVGVVNDAGTKIYFNPSSLSSAEPSAAPAVMGALNVGDVIGYDDSKHVVVAKDDKEVRLQFLGTALEKDLWAVPLDAKTLPGWKVYPGEVGTHASQEPPDAAFDLSVILSAPIKGYLHPKSGKFKYPKISSVTKGVKVADKDKKEFTVLGHMGAQTVVEMNGTKWQVPGDTRVKVAG